MGWQQAPAGAATYPAEQPPRLYATGFTSTYAVSGATLTWNTLPEQPLTLRKDPASGIVYATGSWNVTNAGGASLFPAEYRLPAAFRPLRSSYLFLRIWNSGNTPSAPLLWTVNPDGSFDQLTNGNVNLVVLGSYFTDV